MGGASRSARSWRSDTARRAHGPGLTLARRCPPRAKRPPPPASRVDAADAGSRTQCGRCIHPWCNRPRVSGRRLILSSESPTRPCWSRSDTRKRAPRGSQRQGAAGVSQRAPQDVPGPDTGYFFFFAAFFFVPFFFAAFFLAAIEDHLPVHVVMHVLGNAATCDAHRRRIAHDGSPAACVPNATPGPGHAAQVIANAFDDDRTSWTRWRDDVPKALWRTHVTVNILALYADARRQVIANIGGACRCPER